jgi:hypothetical protein
VLARQDLETAPKYRALTYGFFHQLRLAYRFTAGFAGIFNQNGGRMLTVYDCIMNAHDLRLVALAAVICALASVTAISLLHHVRRSTGQMRLMWLAVSAASTGFGIWATHFIAMLAFSPGIASAYNVPLTFLSLVAAIVLRVLPSRLRRA